MGRFIEGIFISALSATTTGQSQIVIANPFIPSCSVMSTKCISCKQPIRARQEGLQCDGCLRWQHRKCGTGECQSDYRDAVKNGTSIDWRCSTCDFAEPILLAESTPPAGETFFFTISSSKNVY